MLKMLIKSILVLIKLKSDHLSVLVNNNSLSYSLLDGCVLGWPHVLELSFAVGKSASS